MLVLLSHKKRINQENYKKTFKYSVANTAPFQINTVQLFHCFSRCLGRARKGSLLQGWWWEGGWCTELCNRYCNLHPLAQPPQRDTLACTQRVISTRPALCVIEPPSGKYVGVACGLQCSNHKLVRFNILHWKP